MGLYDNYKLRNSNGVYKYAGAPVEEMAKVGNYLQESYMMNKDQYDVLGQTMQSANVLDADRTLFQEKMGSYRSAIQDASKAGNYEDMTSQTRQLARKFKADYDPFVANRAAMAAEDEELAKGVASGKIDKNTADRIQRNRVAYGGLKVGDDGLMTNQYKARTVSGYVDVDDKIRKAVMSIPAHKLSQSGHGGVVVMDGGRYMVKTELGIEEVQPGRIKEVVDQVMADPLVNSYMKQDAELNYGHLTKVNPEDLSDENPIKAAAIKASQERGIPFVDAYRQLASQYDYQNKGNSLRESFAKTYGYKNTVTKNDIGAETAGSKEERSRRNAEYSQSLKDASDAKNEIVFEGATSNNPERSYDDVASTVTSNKATIEQLKRQVAGGKMSTQDRDNANAQIKHLEGQLKQDRSMLDTTIKERLKDMPDSFNVQLYEGGLKNFGGRTVPMKKAALEQAFRDGKVSRVGGVTYVETSRGRVEIKGDSIPVSVVKGFNKLLGSIVDTTVNAALPGARTSVGRRAADAMAGAAPIGEQINDRMSTAEENVRTNSTLSNQSSLIHGLTSKEQTAVSNQLASDPNGWTMMDKDNQPYDGEGDIKITGMSTEVGENGNNYLLGADKKGNPVKILQKGTSTLYNNVAARSKGTAGNQTLNAMSKAALDAPVPLAREIPIPGGKTAHSAVKKQTAGGAIGYYLLDKAGNVLKDNEGNDMYTTDMNKIAQLEAQK